MITGMKINVGDKVSFKDDLGEEKSGEILSVLSDMDSYEDMILRNGAPCYWSKKMKKYTPVKEKNIESVFLEIKTKTGFDYIGIGEIVL